MAGDVVSGQGEAGYQASLLRMLLDHSDDLVLAVDARLALVLVSCSVERAVGRPAAELLGGSVVQAGLFGADAPPFQARLAATLQDGTASRAEFSWRRGDGAPRAYLLDVVADRDTSGKVVRVLARARDVTDQRRIESELRQRETDFRTLAENSPDNIIRYGLDGRAVYCNREIEQRVTVTASHIVGRTPTEAAPPGMVGAPAYEAQLMRTLATGEPGTAELLVPHPSGEIRVHSIVFAAERDAHGAVCGAVAVGRDVTEQVRVRQALAEKEREFRTLAENSPDVIVRYDLDMRVVYCNSTITERSGVPVANVLGRRALEAMPPGMVGREDYLRQLADTLATGRSGSVDLQSIHPSGELRAYNVEFIAERDDLGAVCGALAVGREVTQQVRANRALAAKEREFRTLAENAGDNIMRWDTDGRVRYMNPAMARVLSLAPEQMLGRTVPESFQDGRFDAVHRAVRRVACEGQPTMVELRFPGPGDQGTFVHQIRIVPERDESGAVCSVLGIGRDITEQIEQLEFIESLVRTDPLTRLANRQALSERASAMFATASRRTDQVGIMVLDLDHFKAINDGMGHSAGDTLLCEIAQRLTACMRANDLLVRLGGDEFVIVAPDIADAEVLGGIAAKLHRALVQPFRLAQREVHVTASIGVAVFPADGEGLEELLAHADSAMYHAKRSGRGRSEYYRRELSDAVERRLLLEASMHDACHGTGLELHYQPQVCLGRQDVVVGAEALLRWRHPSMGLLTPDAFIALAEETGMIVPIGHWVLRTAAQAAVRWNRGRDVPLRIAVNVSTRQFVADDLPALVDSVLAQTGCDPRWLSVEITESALLEDSTLVRQVLDTLRTLGVRVALDDFGTGYSALNYLARFRVDCLKIDKSFVQGIGRSERESELVKAFIAMAAALNLDLVAEGVETDAQAAFLLENGCQHGQGYRFGRPMPVAEFERFVSRCATA